MLIPKSGRWKFVSYIDESGTNLVNATLKSLGSYALGSFVTAHRFVVTAQKTHWSRPHASSLGDNIYVIRFTDKAGTQHRFFGFFDDNNDRFVICLYGTERDDKYEPSNYVQLTKRIRESILKKPFVRAKSCCIEPNHEDDART